MGRIPKITFITPAYNGARYLRQAVESIKNQVFPEWECIMVDDGSTDGTYEMMLGVVGEDGRFRVIRHDVNRGLSAARNSALRAAVGVYVINLDCDDILGPYFAQTAYNWMTKHKDCPAVYGKVVRFDDSGWRREEPLKLYPGMLGLLNHNAHNVTACYRLADALAIGGYDERLRAYEDWAFWVKLYDRCGKDPVGLDVVSFSYRVRPDGLCAWADKRRKTCIETMKDTLRDVYERQRPEATTAKPVWVVIPYISTEAQGREIVYAVAGWNRHFREPHRICIVGDRPPREVLDMPGVEFIEKARQRREDYPDEYLPHIDHCHKFLEFLNTHPEEDGFIFVADDCYAVNDFDLPFVRALRLNGQQMENRPSLGSWHANEAKTGALLKKKGFPTRGWVTHLPIYYERKKLMHIIEEFDMLHNSYVIEDLYFNIWYPHRVAQLLNIDYDCVRCGVWRSNPRLNYIDNAFKGKVWITNSVQGWIPELEKRLKAYYGV